MVSIQQTSFGFEVFSFFFYGTSAKKNCRGCLFRICYDVFFENLLESTFS